MSDFQDEGRGAPNIIINQQIVEPPKKNSLGTAGFVLAIIAIVLGWVPVLGWIIWFLGVLFSFIGIFKAPRGLSIAGLIISTIGIILILTLFGAILGSIGMSY